MSKPKRYDLTVYLDRKDKLSPSYYPIYFEVFDEIRGTFIINDIVEAFRDA